MPACHAAIVLSVLLAPATAVAQSDMGRMLSPRFGDQKVQTDYTVRGSFDEPLTNQRGDLQMTDHRFHLAVPILTEKTSDLTVSLGLKAMDIDSSARFNRSWDALPPELWDLRIGTTYRRKLDNGWTAGGNVTIGSASNHLFASAEEIVASVTGFVRIPHKEHTAWLVFLNYSNEREFCRHIPLPGAGYEIAPDRTFRALLGAPFSNVHYEPIEGLTFDARYIIPRTVHAELGYRIVRPVKVYGGFDWSNQRWFRYDRDDDDDRLFYYEKKVFGGVRWDIARNVWADFTAGWAFDRSFFEAEGYDERADDVIDIDDGPYLMFNVGFRM